MTLIYACPCTQLKTITRYGRTGTRGPQNKTNPNKEMLIGMSFTLHTEDLCSWWDIYVAGSVMLPLVIDPGLWAGVFSSLYTGLSGAT